MLDIDSLLAPPIGWNAVAALSDEEHDAFMEEENARLDGLFFGAQSIAREHPEWLQHSSASEAATIAQIRDQEDLPEPEVADGFVRWVYANLEWETEMNQLIDNAKLGSIALQNAVGRNLMRFTDFQRMVRTGQPDPANPDNVRVFLRMQKLELRWNEWWQRQEAGTTKPGEDAPDTWVPLDDAYVGRLLTLAGDTHYQFRPTDTLFRRTIEAIAREKPYDPVIEQLVDLQSKWDGRPRLSTWLARACGVPCDLYHQAVGRNLLGGMVKRARHPGSKHDEVVIFIGPQGTYKSTLCRILATRAEYFTDSVAFDGSPQNVVPQLFGKWLIELAELDGMANRETTFLKRFISAQSDNVTLKYRATASDYARRCVFVGTSNDDKVLRDATGNRRFLPVRIERAIDVAWVRENLEQLLGEAATIEASGADFSIPENVLSDARVHQESARAEADFETHLNSWFEGDAPLMVNAADVAVLLREATGKSVPANRYGATMRRLGFAETRCYIAKKRTRVWLRGDEQDAQRIVLTRDTATGRLMPRPGGTTGQMWTPSVPPPCPAPRG